KIADQAHGHRDQPAPFTAERLGEQRWHLSVAGHRRPPPRAPAGPRPLRPGPAGRWQRAGAPPPDRARSPRGTLEPYREPQPPRWRRRRAVATGVTRRPTGPAGR